MVQFGLVCRQESDYFQNALQENSNNTNTAEVEHLKQKIAQLTLDINALKIENSSLKVEKENLSKERKNDAKQIKRLENERKSLENKSKAVKLRHEKVSYSKLGCVVRMVVDSILPHVESGPNDHRKDASQFSIYIIIVKY